MAVDINKLSIDKITKAYNKLSDLYATATDPAEQAEIQATQHYISDIYNQKQKSLEQQSTFEDLVKSGLGSALQTGALAVQGAGGLLGSEDIYGFGKNLGEKTYKSGFFDVADKQKAFSDAYEAYQKGDIGLGGLATSAAVAGAQAAGSSAPAALLGMVAKKATTPLQIGISSLMGAGDIMDKAERAGVPLKDQNKAEAAGFALGYGVTEVALDPLLFLQKRFKLFKDPDFQKALNTKAGEGFLNRLGTVVKGGLRGGTQEGVEELAQGLMGDVYTGLQLARKNNSKNPWSDAFNYASEKFSTDEAVQGAIGGAVLGTMGGLLERDRKYRSRQQLMEAEQRAFKNRIQQLQENVLGKYIPGIVPFESFSGEKVLAGVNINGATLQKALKDNLAEGDFKALDSNTFVFKTDEAYEKGRELFSQVVGNKLAERQIPIKAEEVIQPIEKPFDVGAWKDIYSPVPETYQYPEGESIDTAGLKNYRLQNYPTMAEIGEALGEYGYAGEPAGPRVPPMREDPNTSIQLSPQNIPITADMMPQPELRGSVSQTFAPPEFVEPNPPIKLSDLPPPPPPISQPTDLPPLGGGLPYEYGTTPGEIRPKVEARNIPITTPPPPPVSTPESPPTISGPQTPPVAPAPSSSSTIRQIPKSVEEGPSEIIVVQTNKNRWAVVAPNKPPRVFTSKDKAIEFQLALQEAESLTPSNKETPAPIVPSTPTTTTTPEKTTPPIEEPRVLTPTESLGGNYEIRFNPAKNNYGLYDIRVSTPLHESPYKAKILQRHKEILQKEKRKVEEAKAELESGIKLAPIVVRKSPVTNNWVLYNTQINKEFGNFATRKLAVDALQVVKKKLETEINVPAAVVKEEIVAPVPVVPPAINKPKTKATKRAQKTEEKPAAVEAEINSTQEGAARPPFEATPKGESKKKLPLILRILNMEED